MTTRTCLAKLIPARSGRIGLLACLILCTPAPAADLTGLARAYRESPTPAHRDALESYAAAHAGDNTGSLARLALGIATYEQKDYSAAIAALEAIQSKLPQIADYTAYYLAAARVELNEGVAAKDLAPAHAAPSPLSGKAWLLEARARPRPPPRGGPPARPAAPAPPPR